MQIGIDATALPTNPVGAGNYIIQLIRSLAALETEHQFVVFAQQSGRKLIGELPPQRVKWVVLRDISPAVRLLWEQVRLPTLVKRSRVDVLHSLHYTRPAILPCKSVVTFHDMTFFLFPKLHTRSKRLFFPFAIRQSARYADALITVSESTRRDSIRILGIPPNRIFSIPLGISEEFHPIENPALLEEWRQRFHLPEEFILYVGLIEPRKNVPLLIKAYARLASQGNPPTLVLVGRQGWMYEQVFQLIDQLKLKDKVQFTGYISSQNMPIVYNLAQLFVYPSTYEGFGFPPLEAMACGTPVITTAISAMLDNVGNAGLLIPPQDETALSQAIQTLLSNGSLRDHLSRVGRVRAAEFTWNRTAMETLKVYQLIGAKS
jgi:glycosyltransferase involved in cell wall biosynthesis